MTVQHFLVPIDFSPYAEQALDSAIALAQKLQARVTLLDVIQPPAVVNVNSVRLNFCMAVELSDASGQSGRSIQLPWPSH
jgi:nucleotide-binding universal stress UspA family protein